MMRLTIFAQKTNMKINAKKTNWFKKYRKNTWKASSRPISIVWGYLFLLILAGLLTAAYIRKQQSTPLISPVAVEVMPVLAKEPSVVISCDNPRGYLECQVYKGVIDWEQYRVMEAIAEAESHFDENAIGYNDGSIDRGIFQINNKYHKKLANSEAFDFKKNIDYAIKVMKSSGYSQWSAYKNGSYKLYLDK